MKLDWQLRAQAERLNLLPHDSESSHVQSHSSAWFKLAFIQLKQKHITR